MIVEPLRGAETERDRANRMQQVISEINPLSSVGQKLARLRAIMDAAIDTNPYQRPAMAVPPSITVSAGSDGTLTVFSLAAAGALTQVALDQVAFYGGVPTAILTTYVAMPVASVLPATNGNIGSGLLDKNQWASAIEIVTDSDKVQFGYYTSSAVKHMFQVDGQYVDFAGTAGNAANNADTFFLLTFASRKTRRIRALIPSLPSKGPTLLKSIRISPTCSFWKPNLSQVYRCGWLGDSYGEGTNGAASIYPVPNAAWPVLTCELLGIRDCRQLSVGSTGYISTAGGTRSKLRDQLPNIVNQAPFDMFVISHGYNDASSTPAALAMEALAAYRTLRAMYPTTPIVVLGCQAGAGGPSAAQIAAENAIASAVAAFADPLCKFAPVSTDAPTWLNGTGKIGATNGSGNSDVYIDPDGAHPSLAGAEFLAYRSAVAIRSAMVAMG